MKLEPYDGYFWQGERVCLRPLRIEDAESKWQEWFDTPARRLLEYGLDLPPVPLTKYREDLLESCNFGGDTSHRLGFAIDNLQGEFIGWINVFFSEPQHGRFGAGMGIFRDHRRKGYALDALRIVLKYGFRERRMEKFNAECLAINAPSIGMQRKLGLVEEGRRREQIYMDGARHDVILFGMTKAEYDALNPPTS